MVCFSILFVCLPLGGSRVEPSRLRRRWEAFWRSLCGPKVVYFNAMQCKAIQCNTVRLCNGKNAIQCNAIHCNAIPCNASNPTLCDAMQRMQSNAVQCNPMQCNPMQSNAIQCNPIQFEGVFLWNERGTSSDRKQGGQLIRGFRRTGTPQKIVCFTYFLDQGRTGLEREVR